MQNSGFYTDDEINYWTPENRYLKDFENMKKIIAIASLLAFISVLGLGGCSTMEGMGKDIEKGGQAIEGAAKK